MCFSATASFTASAVIGAIGITAVVKTRSPPQLLLAAIPLLFSLQQLSEGLLWLSIKRTGFEEWQSLFKYTFLVCALAIWPFWIPLSIRVLEKDERRKRRLNVFILIGAFVSIGVICFLLLFPVSVIPTHHHLHYQFDLSNSGKYLIVFFSVLYILATIVAPFISSIRRMKFLGLSFLVAYLVSLVMFPHSVVSVWCFFAAIMSIIVIWILLEVNKTSLPNLVSE